MKLVGHFHDITIRNKLICVIFMQISMSCKRICAHPSTRVREAAVAVIRDLKASAARIGLSRHGDCVAVHAAAFLAGAQSAAGSGVLDQNMGEQNVGQECGNESNGLENQDIDETPRWNSCTGYQPKTMATNNISSGPEAAHDGHTPACSHNAEILLARCLDEHRVDCAN